MKVSRKFVKEYVSSFCVFGGQIDKTEKKMQEEIQAERGRGKNEALEKRNN